MSKVTFLEEGHLYINDKGIVIPSVSELIRFKFPDAYKGVPTEILKRKATYGTKCHQYVEDLFLGRTTIEDIEAKRIEPQIKESVKQAEELRKTWCFYIKESEQIVSYKGKYAGTYDLLTEDDFLIDIKTTSELHEDWLSWQLGLYYLASGIRKEYGFVLWLPKGGVACVKQIPVHTFEECEELIKEYEKNNKLFS